MTKQRKHALYLFLALIFVTGAAWYLYSHIPLGGLNALYLAKRAPLGGLESPDTVTLISVDCRYDTQLEEGETRDRLEQLYPGSGRHEERHHSLGKVELTDELTRQELLEAVKADLNGEDYGAKCFEPRHLVRVTKGDDTWDYLICYTCSWYAVYHNRQRLQGLTYMRGSSRNLLDRLLAEAEIEILPESKRRGIP